MSHIKVTNKSMGDGFGSQYQHIISTILICMKHGFQFIYTPIRKMQHNYDDEKDFIKKVENIINFKPFFSQLRDDDQVKEEDIKVYDMESKYVIDRNIDYYATPEALQTIRNMFWANKSKDKTTIFNCKDANVLHVAVHVRRPNPHDNRIQGSDTPDDYYLNVIQGIRERHGKGEKTTQFHLFSQGDISMFEKYAANDTIFHIDEDLTTTFISFVAADILVTSFSSYSYIAAFLSDGHIYYHPFWHPPIRHWTICKSNGIFS